jgi:hypothetical protein
MKIERRAGTVIMKFEPADIKGFNESEYGGQDKMPDDRPFWVIWERDGRLLEYRPEEYSGNVVEVFIEYAKALGQKKGCRLRP